MKKYILIFSSLILFFGGFVLVREYSGRGSVFAEGGIDVTYDTAPLFYVSNMAPGQSATGRVTVKSTSGMSQNVGFKLRTAKLSDILTMSKFTLQVKDAVSGEIIYGGKDGKKLLNIFISPKEIQLFSINPGQSRTLTIIITMDPHTGNFYQGKSINFDISLGFIVTSRFSRI